MYSVQSIPSSGDLVAADVPIRVRTQPGHTYIIRHVININFVNDHQNKYIKSRSVLAGLALTALTRIPGGFDESVENALACSSVRRLTPIFDTEYAA